MPSFAGTGMSGAMLGEKVAEMHYPRQVVSNDLIFYVRKEAEFSLSYVAFMALSGILSAVALLTNSVPVLIGAMVVAPAFPPLALVALGIAGGQPKLAWYGAKIGLLGILLAVGTAMLTTWLLNAGGVLALEQNLFNQRLLEERVRPGWYSVVAAFAAGCAGMLGLVKNKTDTLIGTVASLALVPAGGAAGIAIISGDTIRALGGLTLLLVNVAMIVGTGMLTLVVMSLKSGTVEAEKGNKREEAA